MIKAVFFDIDGTLVSFQTHQIPASTLTALQQLKEKGVLLFIATGREREGLKVLGDFPFDGYITLNGQYCYTSRDEVLYENTIAKQDVAVILQELKHHTFPCGFTMKHGKVYNYRDERVEELHRITKNDGQPAGDISHVAGQDIYQVQAFINEAEEKELMAKLKNCTSCPLVSDFLRHLAPWAVQRCAAWTVFAKQYGFTHGGDNGLWGRRQRHSDA
jgi:HAD superfamily hydrolase (TIGR01484 family)